MFNDSTKKNILQDIKNGKSAPWAENKLKSRELSLSYHRIAFDLSGLDQPVIHQIWAKNPMSERFIKRAFAVDSCASFLEFKVFADDTKKLHNANFCKVRLCPMCSWRRSLKAFGQVSKIMVELDQRDEYEYLFLTLTQRNVDADELASELDKLFKAFKYLTKECKEFSSISQGWFRALEVTHDVNPIITKSMYYKRRKYYDSKGISIGSANPNYNTYHPHFHVIIAVNKEYFRSKKYLNTEQWAVLWQRCLKADYIPIVHIRKVSNNATTGSDIKYGKAIAEVSKYATKSADYLTDDRLETDSAVYTLDLALAGRRLIGMGGIFRKLHKLLNLDDAHAGDLINTDGAEEEIHQDISYIIQKFNWHVGYSSYLVK